MLRRSRGAVLALVLSLPVACNQNSGETTGASSATTPVTSAQAAPTVEAKAPNTKKTRGARGRRGGGGIAQALYNAALREIGLPEAKVAELEKLMPEPAGDAAGRDGAKGMHEAMIAGIEAGKLDIATFDEQNAAMEKKQAERKEGQQKLLNSLHAALDPAQRKAAAEAVQKRETERAERMAKRSDAAGKAGDDKAGDDKKPGVRRGAGAWARGGRGGIHGGALGFERMLGRLELDEAQQKKVDAIKAKIDAAQPSEADRKKQQEAAKKVHETVLAEFQKDSFDAAKLELAPARKAPDMKKHIGYANELLAVLTPEQRSKLVEAMKSGAGRRPMMGPGGRGMRRRPMGFGGPGSPGPAPADSPLDDELDDLDDMGLDGE
ncbi:MAG: Spy/CpxP family protein refolding chaperone [Polyangiaceae bacterium]